MGIYDSKMSCWERHHKGLKQDHAGPGVIKEDVKAEVPEVIGEVKHAPPVTVKEETVFGIVDEEGYLAFDGKTWKTKKGVEAAFENVDEGLGYYIKEIPAENKLGRV